MIVLKLKGGLGNQMFQYAYGYALANKYGDELVLDISDYKKDKLRTYKIGLFNLSYKKTTDKKQIPFVIRFFENKYINKLLYKLNISKIKMFNWIYFLQTHSNHVENENNFGEFKNLYVSGYWQNQSYFIGYENDISCEFKQSYEFENEVKQIINRIVNSNSVALHIRRGDYLLPKNSRYNVKKEYYDEAINKMLNMTNDCNLFVFSDDIKWAKEMYDHLENINFVSLKTKNNDIDEIICMSKCKNNINSNSTFSWWAAWLNNNENKIIINPDRYWDRGMIPKDWIVLNDCGLEI